MTRPLRALLALFTRAVREDVRSKFQPIFRALAVLLLLLLIWINQRDQNDSSAAGRDLLMLLTLVNLGGGTVLGLGTFCSAITEEKEEDRLGLLLMTHLNPLAILLGKSTARFACGMLFVVAQIPFALLCVTLGGVAVGQVLHAYGIVTAYLAFLCNLGLLWSVLCRNTTRAVALTFVSALAIYFFPVLMESSFGGSIMRWQSATSILTENVVRYLLSINPALDALHTVFPSGGMLILIDSIPFHLVGAAVCFGLSWLLFERFCWGVGPVGPARAKTRGILRRARPPRAWLRAIAWKDFHFLTGGWRGVAGRGAIYAALIGGVLAWIYFTFEEGLPQYTVANLLWWCGIILFTYELGSVAGRLFGHEWKEQTLGSLVTLPKRTARLIWEKVSGCLPAFLPSVTIWAVGSWMYAAWEKAERLAIATGSRGYGYGYRYGELREQTEIENDYHTAYVWLMGAEFVLFAALVSYLSLRVRRPLLVGLSVLLVANLAAILAAEALHYDSELESADWFWRMTIVAIPATLALALAIPRRLEKCAAEE
jgi:hypothetical protein